MNDATSINEESSLDFNFWPSFADLMLSIVLILLLVIFLIHAVIAAGTVNLKYVQQSQMNMVQAVAAAYGVKPDEISVDLYAISTGGENSRDILIHNEPVLQRFTFSDRILFQRDDYHLSPEGQETLDIIGNLLKQQLSVIREIQIQGHADTDTSKRFPSNLHLAAQRAIEVFKFLQDIIGIDPAEHLMSATSFGEFKPVQRPDTDSTYNRMKLYEHNSSDELKDRNRRIELLLFYRF